MGRASAYLDKQVIQCVRRCTHCLEQKKGCAVQDGDAGLHVASRVPSEGDTGLPPKGELSLKCVVSAKFSRQECP